MCFQMLGLFVYVEVEVDMVEKLWVLVDWMIEFYKDVENMKK